MGRVGAGLGTETGAGAGRVLIQPGKWQATRTRGGSGVLVHGCGSGMTNSFIIILPATMVQQWIFFITTADRKTFRIWRPQTRLRHVYMRVDMSIFSKTYIPRRWHRPATLVKVTRAHYLRKKDAMLNICWNLYFETIKCNNFYREPETQSHCVFVIRRFSSVKENYFKERTLQYTTSCDRV